MSAPASTHRTYGRSAQVLLRFSPEEREEIKRIAREHGLTVQEFADRVLLGRELPARRPNGQEMLPLIG